MNTACNSIDWPALMEPVALRLLGEPTSKEIGGDTWRYRRKGSLAVHVGGKGGLVGTWIDYESGERGNVLELIQRERSCDRTAALAWLERERLIPEKADRRRPSPNRRKAAQAPPERRSPAPTSTSARTDEDRQAIACRGQLWENAVPADDGPGRVYLAQRWVWPSVEVEKAPPLPDAVRWVSRKTARQVGQRLPAGAVGALAYRCDTATGELTGVQLEALDANAGRLPFGTAKRLFVPGSRIVGSFLRLPPRRSPPHERLLVSVEGPLDALAATWLWPDAEVWCSCGPLRKPTGELDGYTVRIEADGDGPGRTAAAKVRDALEAVEGVSVKVNWRTHGDVAEEWANTVCYERLERAALMETEGGLTREEADAAAAEAWSPSRLWPPWFANNLTDKKQG